MEEPERWVSITGFEGYYEVSNMGRVRSVDRMVHMGSGRMRPAYSKMLRPGSTRYPTLTLKREGKRTCVDVHRLVAIAFIDNPSALPAVNHKDLNRRNNRATNLEWVTDKQNTQHARGHGRFNALTNPKCAPKLTAAEVAEIRMLCAMGERKDEIADSYSISRAHVFNIANGKAWSLPRNSA